MEGSTLVRRPAKELFSNSNFATSGVPVVCVTSQNYEEDYESEDELSQVLPLPASKYRYSKWSELDNIDITSDMLKAPRVRKAPYGFKEDSVWMLEEQERAEMGDDDSFFENQRKPKKKRWGRGKRKQYRNKLENWEQCEIVNLSYQDLGHPYQMKEFLKVLRRLIRSDRIELIEDSLTDLSSVHFPRCRCLYLQRNHITNLKKLPKFGCIEHISLQQNNITDLHGLEVLKQTSITSLTLKENPVCLQPGYRNNVFTILPGLKLLDDLPRLPTDISSQDEPSKCIVS